MDGGCTPVGLGSISGSGGRMGGIAHCLGYSLANLLDAA